ncbi:hypothetical protein BD408DRAFT_419358 [Parasitella parasitica]|nr:hypothetical protein BD408DRAFT_419358 [Parasitella parasitica]
MWTIRKKMLKNIQVDLKDLGDVEICYNMEPNQPILVSMERILNDPESYHLLF